jgi:hypothetical protein
MVGVLVAQGPGVRPGATVEEASILDLAPTILHYMDLEVPDYMDGRVLTELLTDDFNHGNPVRSRAGNSNRIADDAVYTEDEEEAVIAKLRDMGYVA